LRCQNLLSHFFIYLFYYYKFFYTDFRPYTKVLFDTGVTHSFVSTSWVESHNIPIEPMIPPLRVNSVGGKFSPIGFIQI
jgi:hypothetical protein